MRRRLHFLFAREPGSWCAAWPKRCGGLGYDVWVGDQLPPHLSYGDVIAQKVGGAKAAIVVWSANAIESEWVRAEADLARGQKKLIQTTIDGRDPPMPFNQLHYVSLADWEGADDHPGWSKVKESLAALCGAPGAEATIPAAPPRAGAAPPAVPAPPPAAGACARLRRRRGARRAARQAVIILIAVSLLVIAAARCSPDARPLPPGPPQRGGGGAGGEARRTGGRRPGGLGRARAVQPGSRHSDGDGYTNVRSGPWPRPPSSPGSMPARPSPPTPRTAAGGGSDRRRPDRYMERSRSACASRSRCPRRRRSAGGAGRDSLCPGGPRRPRRPGSAAAPSATQRPARGTGPRLVEENAGVLRDFCRGAGAGTPDAGASAWADGDGAERIGLAQVAG